MLYPSLTLLLILPLFGLARLPPSQPPHAISLEIEVRTGGWALEILEVREVGSELWTLARLDAPDGPATQAITDVSAHVALAPGKRLVRHFVLDGDQALRLPREAQSLETPKQLPPPWHTGRVLYKKKVPAGCDRAEDAISGKETP